MVTGPSKPSKAIGPSAAGEAAIQESEHADRPHTAIGTRHSTTSPPNGKLLGTTKTMVPYIAESEGVSLNVLAAIVRSLPNLKRGLIDVVSWIRSVPTDDQREASYE
jgi:hypothetical protein